MKNKTPKNKKRENKILVQLEKENKRIFRKWAEKKPKIKIIDSSINQSLKKNLIYVLSIFKTYQNIKTN